MSEMTVTIPNKNVSFEATLYAKNRRQRYYVHGIASRQIREQTRQRLGTTRATTRMGTQRQNVFTEIVQVLKKAISIGTGSELFNNLLLVLQHWDVNQLFHHRIVGCETTSPENPRHTSTAVDKKWEKLWANSDRRLELESLLMETSVGKLEYGIKTTWTGNVTIQRQMWCIISQETCC